MRLFQTMVVPSFGRMGAMVNSLAFLFLLALVFPPAARAYIDPGTGSYVAQIIIASLAGGLYLLVSFRQRVVALLKRFSSVVKELLKIPSRGSH